MTKNTHSSPPLLPIAIAEGASTAVSLGALYVMERAGKALDPLERSIGDALFYPALARKTPPTSPEQDAALHKQAEDKASVYVKGAGMIATGFAAHLPLQLALEGKVDAQSFKMAALGKGVGVATSLGGIVLLSKVAPSAMPKLQEALMPLIRPFIPKDKREGEAKQDEVAKLLVVDLTSSVVAGLMNYAVSQKMRG